MQDISNITIKMSANKEISFALFDQNDQVIPILDSTIVVADLSVADYRVKSPLILELRPQAVGSTTMTISAKGINKVLNITVVAATPTAIKVFEGAVSFINREVYD